MTIQAAIDAARPGGTVQVKADTCNEALRFKAGITLKGNNAETTIVRFSSPPTGVVGHEHYEASLQVRDCGSGTLRNLTCRQKQPDPRVRTVTMRFGPCCHDFFFHCDDRRVPGHKLSELERYRDKRGNAGIGRLRVTF